MKNFLDRASWVGVVLLAAFVTLRATGCSVHAAPKPAVFSDAVTLDAAMRQSAANGKPVFVVATADWCGPCQAYKKGALSQYRVAQAIRDRAIPVYLDVDHDTDAANSLGISSIPATFLIVDGKVAANFTGGKDADDLIRWLDEHAKG